MTVCDFIVSLLAKKGVSDVFGVPGGVILELLYAFDRSDCITPHLSYHEQGAAFEACGYAQYEHKLGVAYSTRGPGFTNLLTGVADAYADSIPVLFITAHANYQRKSLCRFEEDQEMDTISMVKNITKYAKVIDDIDDVVDSTVSAISSALEGRKGPVFLDFNSRLWKQTIHEHKEKVMDVEQWASPREDLINLLSFSKRPVLLVGDGVRQSGCVDDFSAFCNRLSIPVLSSRCSQDVGALSNNYYGYVGSHGIRYSNYIFSKADLVISLGNRLGFPLDSKSFTSSLANKKVYRIDIDDFELQRDIPNTINCKCSIAFFLDSLKEIDFSNYDYSSWIRVCDDLRNQLIEQDGNEVVAYISSIFKQLQRDVTVCCDVGNNEFWVSKAYVDSGIRNRIIYSKSFGVVGCSIPKSIGIALSSRKPVLCITGDQGFQLNAQELQLMANEKLSICIIVINNNALGMIKDRENRLFTGHLVHTTKESGYVVPNIELLAHAYSVEYSKIISFSPSIVEIIATDNIELVPSIPKGNPIQDMIPPLSRSLKEKLKGLS